MDQSVKIAAACSVLVGGIVVALMFRHEAPRTGPPVPGASDRLVLRKQVAPRPSDGAMLEPRKGGFKLSESTSSVLHGAGRPATVFGRMDHGQPPPVLAKDYPASGTAGTSRWGTSIGLPLPGAARPDESARRHKIVDGDTLGGLAEKYLGTADRALEIYEANREVLPGPELLPIGAELEIPSGRNGGSSTAQVPTRRALVPIHREARPEE
jgi:nucleoid-associated protein YgaU